MSRPPDRPLAARLSAALGTQLPDARETLLLRACLHGGNSGRDAWDEWTRRIGDGRSHARSSLAPFAVLLPLLLWNLRRNGVHVGGPLGTCLRAARATEELRWERFARICRSALLVLHDAGIPFIALKGIALGESAYPLPALRHASDIDVLLEPRDLARASDRLRQLGWRQAMPSIPASTTHLPAFVHASGLPLELHHRLLIPYYTLPYDVLWARSEPAEVTGIPGRVLSPADSLLHVCAHAMLGGRVLHWVTDAWFVLHRNSRLDWQTLAATASIARLGLPAYLALRYLQREMAAPVPQQVLDALRIAAEATGRRGLSASRPWPRGSVGEIWAGEASPWRRMLSLAQRAFPPPLAYALRYDLPLWRVPISYVVRLGSFARGRARVARR